MNLLNFVTITTSNEIIVVYCTSPHLINIFETNNNEHKLIPLKIHIISNQFRIVKTHVCHQDIQYLFEINLKKENMISQ